MSSELQLACIVSNPFASRQSCCSPHHTPRTTNHNASFSWIDVTQTPSKIFDQCGHRALPHHKPQDLEFVCVIRQSPHVISACPRPLLSASSANQSSSLYGMDSFNGNISNSSGTSRSNAIASLRTKNFYHPYHAYLDCSAWYHLSRLQSCCDQNNNHHSCRISMSLRTSF